MIMVELYRHAGLAMYEQVHYARGEHIDEVEQILSWYKSTGSRVLDVGCSAGLHALEFAGRGHRVTGIDLEPSAVRLARKRNRERHLAARFLSIDIQHDSLAPLGRFDLIYSIGNVLSHVRKERLRTVLRKIKRCCAADGTLLFDIFIIGPEFQEELRDDEHGIAWKRKLDAATGMIHLQGAFTAFAVTQDFQVWGHTVEEVVTILQHTGFTAIEYAESLDFPDNGITSGNPFCLRFRARG